MVLLSCTILNAIGYESSVFGGEVKHVTLKDILNDKSPKAFIYFSEQTLPSAHVFAFGVRHVSEILKHLNLIIRYIELT